MLKQIMFPFLTFTILLAGCSGGGGSGSSSGTYSYTLEDTSLNLPSGQYIGSAFKTSSNIYDSVVSLTVPFSLPGNNSVYFPNIDNDNCPYTIFVWIDDDGDNQYGDDYRGTVITIFSLMADVTLGSSGTLSTFNHKQIQVTAPGTGDTDNKTAHCYWVVGGKLDETMKASLRSSPASVNELVGMVNATLGVGAGPFNSSASVDDFPLIVSGIGYFGVTYDLYVYVEGTSNNWEASLTGEDSDDSAVSVTLAQM